MTILGMVRTKTSLSTPSSSQMFQERRRYPSPVSMLTPFGAADTAFRLMSPLLLLLYEESQTGSWGLGPASLRAILIIVVITDVITC